MDLAKYFTRIGFDGAYEGPDLATLKLIHKLHVMSIPFENLNIHCGVKVTMGLEVAFDKIVNQGRGGWCFENNLLFSWVLQQMGYNSTILGARVFNTTLNEFGPQETHLINKVVFNEKAYIADVSFGTSCQVWEPVELVSGTDQHQAAGAFRLLDNGDMWVLEMTCRKPEVPNPLFADSRLLSKRLTKPIYCFTLEPRCQDDFAQTCHSLQTDPTSLFTNKSICSLQTATGFKALVGWTYSQITFSPEKNCDIYDMYNITDDEAEKVLRKEFNINISKSLQLCDRKPMCSL